MTTLIQNFTGILFLFFISLNVVFADQITITFVNPDPSGPTGTCGQMWTENGVPLEIIPASGYGGPTCQVNYSGGALTLFEGSALSVDLSSLGMINSVSTNFNCNCGTGCLSLWLKSGGSTLYQSSNSVAGQTQSITLNNTGDLNLDQFIINLCDDNVQIFDITIDFDPINVSTTKIDFTNPIPDAPVGCTDDWIEVGIPLSLRPNGGGCFPVYGNGQLIVKEHTQFDVNLSNVQNISSISTLLESNTACLNFKYFAGGILIDESQIGTTNGNIMEVFANTNFADIDLMRVHICDDSATLFCINIQYFDEYPGCEPDDHVTAESADFYVADSCHGMILTSPNGLCYRLRVNDDGSIKSELIDCP